MKYLTTVNRVSRRTSLFTAACLLTLFSTPGSAELTGNITFATDYVDRGISNSNRGPAIQGGLDYAHESGLYLGTWASNVDFDDGEEASGEVDFYAGYSAETAGISWDAGLQRIIYPGADDALEYDSTELYLSAAYDLGQLSLSATYYYSADYFGSGNTHYLATSVGGDVGYGFYLSGQVGRQVIEDNAFYGTPDYTHWGVTLERELEGFDLSLAWQTTNMNSQECYAGTDWCDSTMTFSVSRTFSLLE